MKTLLALAALLCTLAAKADTNVTVEGILYAHAAAIGGETTGVIVQHDDGTYTELETDDPHLMLLIEKYDLQRVVTSGSLRIIAGVEIPERRILTLLSIAPLNRDVVCKATASDYRLEISLERLQAHVLKGPTKLTTLNCTKHGTLGARYSCYEPMMADAGYQMEFYDTSGVVPHAELYEVFIWGRKLVDKLTCLP